MSPSSSALLKRLSDSFPASRHAFLRDFVFELNGDDIASFPLSDWPGIVETHWNMASRRTAGQALIAFTPQMGKTPQEHATHIDMVVEDRSFIVDSLIALLTARDLTIEGVIYPRLSGPRPKSRKTAHIHLRIRGILSAALMAELEKDTRQMLRDVQDATDEWQKLRDKIISCRDALLAAKPAGYRDDQLAEYAAFLDYLQDGNFTLMGAIDYAYDKGGKSGDKLARVAGSGIGLLRESRKPFYLTDTPDRFPPEAVKLMRGLEPVSFAKAHQMSTVHRRVALDIVTIKHFSSRGVVTGETMVIGLFTSVTYSRSLRGLPYLRWKANEVITRSGYEPNTHQGRALRHILEKYPRDEFLQADLDLLLRNCLSIMKLQERQRIALYLRDDPFGRYVSALIYVPRGRYETRLRLQFQSILEQELHGRAQTFFSTVDDSPLVRLHYMIAREGAYTAYDSRRIEKRLQESGQPWADKLRDALHGAGYSSDDVSRLHDMYSASFSSDYQEQNSLNETIRDIAMLETMAADDGFKLRLTGNGDRLHFKIYRPENPMPLSDVLTLLTPMGIRAITEFPYQIRRQGHARPLWIQDFELAPEDGNPVQLDAKTAARFEDTFTALTTGTVENDVLNRLILRTPFTWRQVALVRAYARYMRHLALPYSSQFIDQALVSYPSLIVSIVRLFEHDHNFDAKKNDKQRENLVAAIKDGFDKITLFDHDYILRALLACVDATLRTNYYLNKDWISLKFASESIADLPKPVPYREIFVYSPRTEGVHLRSGRIARGGIRWSDRHEDFRTEILDLMKAQKVKNVVIVPGGAKGGFITKRGGFADRKAYLAEGVECYKILVRGLLDVTDTIKNGKVIAAPGIKRRDDDDPYLVVAADKGTASYSDTANALSAEYGFWLDDAFASGGSAGYDHKKMGITARGAWESVKRHFREKGRDIQKEPFNVIGVGDMSGDVFGNGMLLSKFIRLIAAFNHSHIILDPAPDIAASFAERKRLFTAALNWDQYDKKTLSKGGMVISRTEKSVKLTREVRERFGFSADTLSPHAIIRALLAAPTDLLYFGGIGTYIKASGESNADVKDKANDAVRIDACDLHAGVIAEGANLAMTQAARIEAALSGVKLNTDFIDNSAGVDTSDHEVNIKILLSQVMADKKRGMTRAKRDTLLKSMTHSVAELVLADNYQQTQAISLIERSASFYLPIHRALIEHLEGVTGLHRKRDGLPTGDEMDDRMRRGLGLVRPEIAVMLSHSKMAFRDNLMQSGFPADPANRQWLIDYFPQELQEFDNAIDNHPLRQEIIATCLTNMIINRLGPGRVRDLQIKCGGDAAAVARGYTRIHADLELGDLYRAIESLDGFIPGDRQLAAFSAINALVDHPITVLTKNAGLPVLSTYSHHRALFDKNLGGLLTQAQQARINKDTADMMSARLPETVARRVAQLRFQIYAYDILMLGKTGKDIQGAARLYFHVLDRLGIAWLLEAMLSVHLKKAETQDIINGLHEQILDLLRALVARIITGAARGKPVDANAGISQYLEKRADALRQYDGVMTDIRSGSDDAFDPLSLLRVIQALERL